MHAETVALLTHVFPGMPTEHLLELAEIVREKDYPAHTILCHEGEIESTFYIVKVGRVEVTKLLDGEISRVLNRHSGGEFFGEIGLIQSQRRAASVTTIEPTVVLELEKASFDDFLMRSPAVGLALMRQVAARLRHSDQAAIGELRQINQQLTQAYRDLEAHDLMRSDFLTTVAHELRTPLTVAKGYLQLMRSGALPVDKGEAVETIYRHIDKVVLLVNNILFMQEMAMIDLDFDVISSAELLARIMEQNRLRAADLGIPLLLECPVPPPAVRGDVEGLVMALNAIVDNAIKFSTFGQEVILRLGITPDNQQVIFEIEDHGMGIAPQHHEHIFERFKGAIPGTRTASGLGLGLPIAKYLVEKHQGAIAVTSSEGHGSKFTVTLPVFNGEDEYAARAKAR